MKKRIDKNTKVIEINEQDVKKMQREQFLKKRRSQKVEKKPLKERIKFSKKDWIVLAVLAIGILIYYIISNHYKLGIVFNKEISSKDATVVNTLYSDDIVLGYKDCIIVFEKNTLSAYNVKGEKVWNKKLDDMYNPEICVGGSYIQITNNDTGYIYILDGQYEVGRIKLEGEILSAKINSNGTSIIEYSTSGLKTVIGIYNKKGKELYSLKLDNNTVSSYSLSDNSRYLAYAYADISGISLVTKIAVVDLNKLTSDNYEYNNIISKNNELVYKLYWDNNTLHALFNNSIISYKSTSDKLEEYSIANINATDIDIFDSKTAYITTDAATAKYVLNVDKYNGKNIGNVEIIDSPKYFTYQDSLIYMCSQKEINIYNKWGKRIKTYTSDTTITKPIIFDDGKCIAFKISNKIVMFEI